MLTAISSAINAITLRRRRRTLNTRSVLPVGSKNPFWPCECECAGSSLRGNLALNCAVQRSVYADVCIEGTYLKVWRGYEHDARSERAKDHLREHAEGRAVQVFHPAFDATSAKHLKKSGNDSQLQRHDRLKPFQPPIMLLQSALPDLAFKSLPSRRDVVPRFGFCWRSGRFDGFGDDGWVDVETRDALRWASVGNREKWEEGGDVRGGTVPGFAFDRYYGLPACPSFPPHPHRASHSTAGRPESDPPAPSPPVHRAPSASRPLRTQHPEHSSRLPFSKRRAPIRFAASATRARTGSRRDRCRARPWILLGSSRAGPR